MASIKISQLTAAASTVGTQEFEVNESGTSKKVTGTQIKTFVKAGLAPSDLTGVAATAAELNHTSGVTSAIQTQLNAKAPLTGTGTSGTWPISISGDAATTDGKSFGTFTAAGGIAYATTTTSLAAIAAGTAGQVLVSGGAGAPTWGSVIDYQLFTATGTWTKPSGISADAIVYFHVIGGGAGGTAYFRGSGALRYVGGGSGGGGYIGSILASALGATVSVTVGAGGAARTASGSSTGSTGGSGGASSFGSFIAGGGVGGSASSTAGSVTQHGFDGHIGGDSSSDSSDQTTINSIYGGGGGGSGFNINVYAPGVGYIGGGNGGAQANGNNAVASAGSAPGGGGGAAHSSSTTTSGTVTSGAGARGEVRVWTIG